MEFTRIVEEALMEECNMYRKDTQKIAKIILSYLRKNILEGNSVHLREICTISVKDTQPRKFISGLTKSEIEVKGGKRLRLKTSKKLLAELKG